MPSRKSKDHQDLVAAEERKKTAPYVLRLYVAGMTPRSVKAIQRVSEFCEKHLHQRYELEVIDIYQKPALVKGEQIVAVPALIKSLPAPLRKLIGDMHSEEKLLFGLDLLPQAAEVKREAEES